MPFKAAFFDRVICPIPSTNEQGNPFSKWDGSTLGPNGRPSESSSANVRVYGDGSVYCVPLTLQQLYDLYYSTSLNANCKWDTGSIHASVNLHANGSYCYETQIDRGPGCVQANGSHYFDVQADSLSSGGESFTGNLTCLTDEAYQVKSACTYYPPWDGSDPFYQFCDQADVFPGDDLFKNTPDRLRIIERIHKKDYSYDISSTNYVDGTFDANKLACLPFTYPDATVLFLPKGKYSKDLGPNYNPTGITFGEWSTKMIDQFGSDISTHLSDIWYYPENYTVTYSFDNLLNGVWVHRYAPLPEVNYPPSGYFAGALFCPPFHFNSGDGYSGGSVEIGNGGNVSYLFADNGAGYTCAGANNAAHGYFPACVFTIPKYPFLGIDAIRVSDNEFWWNPLERVNGSVTILVSSDANCTGSPGNPTSEEVKCWPLPPPPIKPRTITLSLQYCNGPQASLHSEDTVNVSISNRGYSFFPDTAGIYKTTIPVTYHQPYSNDIDPNRVNPITASAFCLVQAKSGISGTINVNQSAPYPLSAANAHIDYSINWDFSGLVPQQIDVYAHGWPDPA